MWRRPCTKGYGEPAAKDNREYRQLRIKKAMAVTANAKRKVQKTGIAFALIHCSVLRLCILSAGLLLDHLQYRESIISIFRYSEFTGRLVLNGMRHIWIFFHRREYRLACAIRCGGASGSPAYCMVFGVSAVDFSGPQARVRPIPGREDHRHL